MLSFFLSLLSFFFFFNFSPVFFFSLCMYLSRILVRYTISSISQNYSFVFLYILNSIYWSFHDLFSSEIIRKTAWSTLVQRSTFNTHTHTAVDFFPTRENQISPPKLDSLNFSSQKIHFETFNDHPPLSLERSD